MNRFAPRSLLGQVMAVLAVGLLLGQVLSGIMLYRAAEQRRDDLLVNTLAFRMANALDRSRFEDRAARRDAFRSRAKRLERAAEGPLREFESPVRLRTESSDRSPIVEGHPRLGEIERAVTATLRQQGYQPGNIVVTRRQAGADPFFAERPRLQKRLGGPDWRRRSLVVAGIEREPGRWDIVRVPETRPPRTVIGTILIQTLVIFAVLFALMFLLLRRITKPLASLTARVDSFARSPENPVMLEESGPQDVRHLIGAHNAMESRIAAMLDEKDVMLGAIGHDLKTPLAALRVRIENVSDESQRRRMAESIEDITRTLDDILNLARVGRSNEPLERTDLNALLGSVVGEYEDMGDPVSLADGQRVVARVRATWLRRAIRNLVGNALRYGQRARVEVFAHDHTAVVRIDDNGPGIPPGQIATMLEPFARGEGSRNRATGGAGLGLTLARAIAEQHGGSLSLSNRPEGGLRAEIRLPL